MTNPQTDIPASGVLLATDLSCRSDRATDRAADLAEAWNVPLHVVTAVERDFHEPSWEEGLAPALAITRAELEPVFRGRDLHWDLTLEPGAPHDVVLAAAIRLNSRLIVTGVARNEVLGRGAAGRMIEVLAHNAPIPVLVVKRRAGGPYRRILVASDFSPVSELATARVLAMFPEAAFTLLHAYRVPFAGFISEATHQSQIEAQAMEARNAFLGRLEARMGRKAALDVLLEYGSPEQLVADYVEAKSPDLVVVPARRRDGRLRGGGVAEGLLMAARCDVLLSPERP